MYSITDQQRTILWTSNQRYQHTKEKCNVNLITTLVTRNSQQMYTCQHKIIAIVYDDLFCGTSARWCFGGDVKGHIPINRSGVSGRSSLELQRGQKDNQGLLAKD